ncbi:sulfatase [uncultured Chitinophaga sp.]|uniref:sulfatase family protein n=1 Tax=uncultured Chitinophaga sp. TaxID=339340 RepID=UPI0025CE0A6E|nr:sulfatase [uncultured Chitinophaga sp.]
MRYIALLLLLCTLTATAQRPNIIIINMDDMGYGDIEPYGMTGIPTPNFNRAAQQGTRFTHFNAAQAVCSPSRAALLTGCYPNRLGLYNALMPWSTIALDTSEVTIATQLRKAGYTTAMLGKWHLGSKAPYLPIHFGFDSYFGIPYSNDMWPVNYDGAPAAAGSDKARFPVLPLLEGDRVVDSITTMEDQGNLTALFTKRAVNYITTHRKQPFFLYFASPMPHAPIAASARFRGKSDMGLFGDMLMELDWSIGEILNALDKTGLSANTLLIITSDNGPWLRYGDNAGSAGGFREGKGTTWEGGTRVPCIVRWPGKVAQGQVDSRLFTNMDLLPTIAALAGAPLPAKKIDGLDFSKLLLGKSPSAVRDVFYYYYDVNSLRGVRYKNWKLVLPHNSQSYLAGIHGMNGNPGTTGTVKVPMALYDLAHDPGETYDLQKLYPEMLAKLLSLAEDARKDLGDDLTGREGSGRRKAAKL